MCQLACVHAMLDEPVPISTLKLRSSIGRQELFLYGLETPGPDPIKVFQRRVTLDFATPKILT